MLTSLKQTHAFGLTTVSHDCGRYLKDEQKERLPDILANAMLRAEDFAKLDPGMVARILEMMETSNAVVWPEKNNGECAAFGEGVLPCDPKFERASMAEQPKEPDRWLASGATHRGPLPTNLSNFSWAYRYYYNSVYRAAFRHPENSSGRFDFALFKTCRHTNMQT